MNESTDPAKASDVTVEGSSDEQLLARAAEGDQDAYAQLYQRYQGMVYGLALRITRDSALAQDVAQDALVGVWRNAARFAPDKASARTWIMSITHHRSIDALRRRRPTVELPDPEFPPPASMVVPDVWPEVAGRLDRDTVRNVLGELSDVQREAIELAYFSGLTQQEIAVRTDTPLGTVKSRVRLGLLALGRALEAHADHAAGEAADRRASGAMTAEHSGAGNDPYPWVPTDAPREAAADLADEAAP